MILAALVSIVVLCLAGASVGGYVLVKYNSIRRVDNLSLDQPVAGEPKNFLIVAVDTREGQTTKNTDTIMVLRVDPQSDRLALTSFPRDMIVTIADTGRRGMINSAYSRPGDGEGEQVLIDTLRQNFGVPINQFIEVNFDSFKQLVDAIGGVSVWVPTPARDIGSGLYVDNPGCIQLDGENALAFARSRKLEIRLDGRWQHDPKSDESRVQRQQIFIQRALTKALSQVGSNPLRVSELVNIGIDNVRFDQHLGVGEIIDLGNHFRSFSSDKLETYVLPVLPYAPDPNRLVLDEKNAQQALNVFRGLPPGELSPVQATVKVLNATEKQGFARDISGALQTIGFGVVEPDTTEPSATTTVQHAPGRADYGQLVARYLTSPVTLVENPELDPDEVVVVAGADFTTVHDQPAPLAEPTTTGGQPAPEAGGADVGSGPAGADSTSGAGSTAGGGAGGGTTATTAAAPPPADTAPPNPYIIGEPPPGQTCG